MKNYNNYFFILLLFTHGFAFADGSTNQSNKKTAQNTESVSPDNTLLLTGVVGQFGFGSHINDRAFLKKKARATTHENLQQTTPAVNDEKTATGEHASVKSAGTTQEAAPNAVEAQSTTDNPKPLTPNAKLAQAPNTVN